MVTISTITLKVALAIGGAEIFNRIGDFSKNANDNHFTQFTHSNFYYSYPEFGKKWTNNNDHCQFHRVNVKCHLCDHTPERNYAGIGTIYVLNNGICNDEILVSTALKVKDRGVEIIRGKKLQTFEYVKNTPRLSRMILLCKEHTASYFEWQKPSATLRQEIKQPILQLELF